MRKQYTLMTALLTASILAACGGGSGGSAGSTSDSAASSASSTSSSATTASSSSSSVAIVSYTTCPTSTLSGTDAQTLTGDSTPFQSALYGIRNYEAPATIDGKHNPSNYLAAPALPTWQFATSDPTGGALTNLECDVAPDAGWHSYQRSSGTASTITHSKVVVTGGRNAAANHIYTVFNGQQLVAAINEAKNEPKIIRVVGQIDLRWSAGNTVFKEYTSYRDQKFGGSISIPSNTTLVGINDANGNPARITGTTILIGGELGTTTDVLSGATGDPEADFKKWIAASKDGDLYPTWTRNIIIRNLKIDTPWDVNPEDSANAYADGVTISRSQNIWVDHVSLTDGDTPDSLASDTRHDGNLDIVRGSDYVSVTNTFFGDHGKNTLVGNGDSGRAWSDQNRLHVTFSGLWWKGIASRHPLVRYAQLHTYNNLMEGTTDTATYGHKFENGLDVRYQSSVFSENNFHYFSGLKPKEVCGKISGGSSGKEFRVTGAQFINDKDDNGKTWATSYSGPIDVTSAIAAASCSEVPATDITWTPPYSYTALDANTARASIEKNTGAGRIGMYAVLGTARDVGSTSSTSSSATSSAASSSSSVSSSSSSSASSTSSSASSATAGVTASWTEDFASADASTFYTASFKSLPDDASVAMYYKAGGTPSFSSGVMTLTGARMTIGARGSTATTATSTPGGIFNINGRSCTLTINTLEAGTGSGKFQVFVDNNTTTGSNSVQSAATLSSTGTSSTSGSVVVNVVGTAVVSGTNTYTWTLSNANYSGGSFIMLRTESSVTIKIDSASLSCS